MSQPRPVSPAARARAHRALDRMLDLLAERALSGGVLRLDVDRKGRLHLDYSTWGLDEQFGDRETKLLEIARMAQDIARLADPA